MIFSGANLTDKFTKNRETPSTQHQSVMELWGLARIRAPSRIACKGLRWACYRMQASGVIEMQAINKNLKNLKACDLLQIVILVIGIATYLVNRQSETLWVMVAIQVSALVVFKANQQRKKIQ